MTDKPQTPDLTITPVSAERMKNLNRRILFMFWGRRGAMVPFSMGVQRAASALTDVEAYLSVSRQNEAFSDFLEFGDRLVPVDTFSDRFGALAGLLRLPMVGHAMIEEIKRRDIAAIINLMPHLWTPLLVNRFRRSGIKYTTVIHDAIAHPGDKTAVLNRYMLREAALADKVITLSASVRDQLVSAGIADPNCTKSLFLPDFGCRAESDTRKSAPGMPLRVLFFGRIYPYKGLGLFVEACEILRDRGIVIQPGVFGEGDMSNYTERLWTLNAEVENRWISETEIAGILARYDLIALPYVEASQSGVAALGFGAGLPAVATPIGGLQEQIVNGKSGVLAAAVTATAFADAISVLATDENAYREVTSHLASTAESRSMKRFVDEAVDFALS